MLEYNFIASRWVEQARDEVFRLLVGHEEVAADGAQVLSQNIHGLNLEASPYQSRLARAVLGLRVCQIEVARVKAVDGYDADLVALTSGLDLIHGVTHDVVVVQAQIVS